jgi:putative oxidoreductase
MGKAQSIGLLILRIGIGVMFILFGTGKLLEGEKKLVEVGEAMKQLGVTGDFKLWGTVAAVTEIVGGVALITGVLFRPLCFLLLFIMGMCTAKQLAEGGKPFAKMLLAIGHPVDMAFLFLGLLFIGPGRYSLGKYVNPFASGD